MKIRLNIQLFINITELNPFLERISQDKPNAD